MWRRAIESRGEKRGIIIKGSGRETNWGRKKNALIRGKDEEGNREGGEKKTKEMEGNEWGEKKKKTMNKRARAGGK